MAISGQRWEGQAWRRGPALDEGVLAMSDQLNSSSSQRSGFNRNALRPARHYDRIENPCLVQLQRCNRARSPSEMSGQVACGKSSSLCALHGPLTRRIEMKLARKGLEALWAEEGYTRV
jgi:hypothetical protein